MSQEGRGNISVLTVTDPTAVAETEDLGVLRGNSSTWWASDYSSGYYSHLVISWSNDSSGRQQKTGFFLSTFFINMGIPEMFGWSKDFIEEQKSESMYNFTCTTICKA